MNGIRWVRVATGGRRFRTYVGRLPGGRRSPEARVPIEQIVGFTAVLVATIFATRLLPFNAIATFGTGIFLACAVTAALSLIKYDGIPVLGKTARLASLIADRKPTVLAREELGRQAESNPHAFVIDDTAVNAS